MYIVKIGTHKKTELEADFLYCSGRTGGNQEPRVVSRIWNTYSIQDSKKNKTCWLLGRHGDLTPQSSFPALPV